MNPVSWRESDPVGLVHQLPPEDREVGALIAATMAFGKVTAIRNTVSRIFLGLCTATGQTGIKQALLNLNGDPLPLQKAFSGYTYRWIGEKELICFLLALSKLLKQYGTLENSFAGCYISTDPDIGPSIDRFSNMVLSFSPEEPSEGLRYLFPSPNKGSAVKRLCLFLRWVVRGPDSVDLGLWSILTPAQLVIPLDVHIHRIGRCLGMTTRASADWKTAQEITANLRQLNPKDPLVVDFALCHMGVQGVCCGKPESDNCLKCPANQID